MSRLTKKQVHTNWNLVLRDNSTDLHTMKENDYEECVGEEIVLNDHPDQDEVN